LIGGREEGKRSLGIPRSRWENDIETDINGTEFERES
jgi:hypothetical protein